MTSLTTHGVRTVARAAALGVVVGLTATGCVLGDDVTFAAAGAKNDTDETLIVVINDHETYTTRPGTTATLGISRHPGDCLEWRVVARTTDGIEVAHTGPPVCDGDLLTVTQAELDQARQAAGTPPPAPTATP